MGRFQGRQSSLESVAGSGLSQWSRTTTPAIGDLGFGVLRHPVRRARILGDRRVGEELRPGVLAPFRLHSLPADHVGNPVGF